jgi:hypothetical protein
MSDNVKIGETPQHEETTMKAKPHHELATLFPLLQGPAFDALKANIARNGLLHPIVTLDGKVLDGRNRERACLELGIEPQYEEWHGNGTAADYVVATNLSRRDLTKSQRAAIAVLIEPHFAVLARERQRHPGKAGKGEPKADTVTEKMPEQAAGEAREHAATLCGTNSRYVTDAKRLLAEAPDLFHKVLQGELRIKPAIAVLDGRPLPGSSPDEETAEAEETDTEPDDSGDDALQEADQPGEDQAAEDEAPAGKQGPKPKAKRGKPWTLRQFETWARQVTAVCDRLPAPAGKEQTVMPALESAVDKLDRKTRKRYAKEFRQARDTLTRLTDWLERQV